MQPNKKKIIEIFSILGFYLFFAILFTFPLILNLATSLYGYTSDNFSTVWHYWASGLYKAGERIDLVNYPVGDSLQTFHPEIGWSLPFQLLSSFIDVVVLMNLFTLAGFALTGLTTYYLLLYLTKDKLVSLVVGLFFAFSPYHFWQGFVHFNLGFLYTLPLFVLSLLHFDAGRTLKNGFLLGLVFIFTVLTSFYYGFFAVILAFGYFLGQIFISLWQRKNYFSWTFFKGILVAGIVTGAAILPLVYQVFIKKSNLGAAGELPNRPISDLLSLSMRPWDFLLPAPNHPFLGQLSESILSQIKSLSADFKTISAFLPERIVYVGLGVFVGSIIATAHLLRKPRYRQMALLFVLIIICLLLFSAPPFIIVKGQEIRFPSYYLYPYLTFFRVYSRLGIVVLLFLLMLLAMGLGQVKNRRRKLVILAGITLLTFFEFLPFGWGQSTNLAGNQLYSWVKDQPQSKVFAEYPLQYDTADSLIWQKFHGKRLLNGPYGEGFFPRETELSDLRSPTTWLKLQALGIDYVIYHTSYIYDKKNPVNDFYLTAFAPLPFDKGVSWAKEVVSFDKGVILQPTGKLAKAVSVTEGLSEVTWLYDPLWRWEDPDNTIFVYNHHTGNLEVSYTYKVQKGAVKSVIAGDQILTIGKSFTLKPGMNELVFTRGSQEAVEITDFKLSIY